LFTFTRLDNIPRSTPLMHALILCAGLIAIRAFVRLRETEITIQVNQAHAAVENVIMIGSTELTFWSLKIFSAYCPGQWQVVGLLDGRVENVGRSVSGFKIVGLLDHLQPIIDEFAEHGVTVHRVVIGGDEDLLPQDTLREVQRVCNQREIPLDFVPSLFNLNVIKGSVKSTSAAVTSSPTLLPSYFKWKYTIDFVVSGIILLFYAPILSIAAGFAVLDVGWPIVFWQHRLGLGGRKFTIWKIRTLRPPFDQSGQP